MQIFKYRIASDERLITMRSMAILNSGSAKALMNLSVHGFIGA